MWNNELTKRLGIHYPIFKAPMLGCESAELIAAVSNAGGLGIYGVGRSNGKTVRETIRQIRELTDKPFGINVFIPEREVQGMELVGEINQVMGEYRKDLGISLQNFHEPKYELEEQMAVLLEEKVPVVSFTFGYLEREFIEKLKNNGTVVVGTATNVREAVFLEDIGVEVIVGQGSEAGGHRGTFLGAPEHSLIGTMALIPQIVNQVTIPVIAAGGIMDGRGIIAALALGAAGVQMGTAFLTTNESGTHELHKEAILKSSEEDSVLTKTFSGKPARGISNRFKVEMEHYIEKIPGYPIQDALTKDIRDAAARQNKVDYMSLWAGQAPRLGTKMSAEELVHKLVADAEETVNKLKFKND